MKEQSKSPPDKTNEEEIGSLPEKEFTVMIVKMIQGFLGGTVVRSPPANAGDTGSSPGLGGSHMPWSNWAHEPQLLRLCSRAHEP